MFDSSEFMYLFIPNVARKFRKKSERSSVLPVNIKLSRDSNPFVEPNPENHENKDMYRYCYIKFHIIFIFIIIRSSSC
jgi:hypothetical protein